MAKGRMTAAKIAWTKHLVAHADVCGGQLCAKGTRVPVAVILDSLAEGALPAEILRSYPTLRPAHIQAALAYAAELAREEELTPLASHAHQARREPARRVG
ncbi:MAG: hypothetical protein H6Q33_4637 [Deltaproteobacteria bacterium]|jgi:uncharacterized protein (DUF433 family)|nr:hypothetical protein [Deltaproteobacteria bacterium]